MNGEGVSYPAFLLGEQDAKPLAFNGPEALFISGRFRPPLGPMKESILVDSSGRGWTLHAITAIGRWGSWKKRLLLWWRRQYLVDYDATEGPAISLDQLKTHMLQKTAASETALRADTEVDESVRQYYLEGWARARETLVAAHTFQGVADAMGPCSLYADNWFSGRGRSNRAEYLVVVISALVISSLAGLVAFVVGPTFSLAIDLTLGLAVPVWLIGAAAARRSHDFGWSLYPFILACMVIGAVVEGAHRSPNSPNDPYAWVLIAFFPMLILALAIPPGTSGENRYDPQPNPGPSL